MKIPSLSQCALFAGCVVIAACSQSPQLSGFRYTPNFNAPDYEASRSRYRVLYNFGAYLSTNSDAATPVASLIDVGGVLYSTTIDPAECGTYACGGAVFRITTGGKEKVLYTFCLQGGCYDGSLPAAPLIDVGGRLYGTTESGGTYHGGTVFRITTSGKEKVVHSFGNGTDGADPQAGLIDVQGTLYGTTESGGAYCPHGGCGTVFSVTPSGTEKVLYSFKGGSDGEGPVAALVNVRGRLYGTTQFGGVHGDGTVFRITTDGKEKVVHAFKGGSDGVEPVAPLVDVKGTLYGTTEHGGVYGYSGGSLFSITTDGTKKTVYSFGNSTDGAEPEAGLIGVQGTLYGTTAAGGANRQGTVFRVTTDGKEKVLHSFDQPYRWGPFAGLIDVRGTLYGTASGGGAYNGGVVFTLTP